MNQNQEETNAHHQDLIDQAIKLGYTSYKGPKQVSIIRLTSFILLNNKKTPRHVLF